MKYCDNIHVALGMKPVHFGDPMTLPLVGQYVNMIYKSYIDSYQQH